MKIRVITVLLIALSPWLCGDNRRLVAEKVNELNELNRLVLEKIRNIEKYNDKDIYVKARAFQKEDGSVQVVIEKISVDKIEQSPNDINGKVFYLKGKVGKSTDNSKFKLDLKHVLPPEKDNSSASAETEKEVQKKGTDKK
ncbi:MAG: hypothetical protein A2017_15350 [Lentisphaerae bacterium GWF2_44_16]|nr:MAG: hypothetical protein A2017_15350 [Lentisphaerae bacterium GWF2_44_16]